ncbi:replication protein P, partial [Pasteurella multocida]|uniref:replication protein P n=1 Tax=Pasteurella multocida TaxID=747 RepID=UPI0023000746
MPALEELLERIKAYSRYHGFDNQHEFQFKNNVEQYLIFDLYCRNKEFGWSAEELRKHAKAFLKATADKLARGEELPELALALPEKASFIELEEQQKINSQGVAMARAILQGKANV